MRAQRPSCRKKLGRAEGYSAKGNKPQKAGGWEKAESRRLAFIGTPIFAGKAAAQNTAIIIYESNLPCQAFLQKKCRVSEKSHAGARVGSRKKPYGRAGR